MLDIKGLDKADVLAALYNASRPAGMGFIQAGFAGPLDMTHRQAAEIIAQTSADLSFDYLLGRPLKVDLHEDEFEPRWYDEYKGEPGSAERVIAHLRQTGSIHRADGSSFSTDQMSEEEARMFMIGQLQPGAKRL